MVALVENSKIAGMTEHSDVKIYTIINILNNSMTVMVLLNNFQKEVMHTSLYDVMGEFTQCSIL